MGQTTTHAIGQDIDALRSLRFGGSGGFVSLHRFAQRLKYDVHHIEELIRIPHGAAFENPFSRRLQDFMQATVEIIASRFSQDGSLEDAIVWFKTARLDDFGGRTAEEMVSAGDHRALLR